MEDTSTRMKSFNFCVNNNNNNNKQCIEPFRGQVTTKRKRRKIIEIRNDESIMMKTKINEKSKTKQEDTIFCSNQGMKNKRQTLIMPSSSSIASSATSSSSSLCSPANNIETKPRGRRPVALTIPLCHLKLAVLFILCLLVENYIKFCCVNAQQNHHNYFHHNNQMLSHRMPTPEIVSITMPAYSPTRTPINPSHNNNHNNNNNNNVASASSITKQQQTIQQQQQQVFANRNLDPKTSSSSSKFSRTNELDVFLDDINHNELRAIASGKPINDLFKPKAMPLEVTPSNSEQNGENTNSASKQRESARSQLDSSGSEQQIYSECALILQRTYVKNINDPK